MLVAVVCLAGCQPEVKKGEVLAIPFQGRGTDGANHSLLDITKEKDLVVVFYHGESKAGIQLATSMRELSKTNENRLQVVGVTTIAPVYLAEWGMQHPGVVPTMGDMDRRIIESYKVSDSPSVVVVRKGGIEVGRMPGYDPSQFLTMLGKLDPPIKVLPKALEKPVSSDRDMRER